MNTPRKPRTGDPVLDAYVQAVLEAFGSEPWKDVETYAAKAWEGVRGGDGLPWDAVKDVVRGYWRS